MEFLDTNTYLLLFYTAIGIILIFTGIFHKPAIDKLKKTGQYCEGIIFRLGYKTNDSTVKDKITVRFVTEQQEWITEDLNTDGIIMWTGQFKEGQTVPVVYNPDNPKDFTIATSQAPGLFKIIFILIGSIFFVFGIYKLFFTG